MTRRADPEFSLHTTRTRPAIRRSAAVLAFTALAACGGSDTGTNPTVNIAGSYSLRSYNGAPLPVVIATSGGNVKSLLDDVYTLRPDGRFNELWHVKDVQNGVTTTRAVVDSGTVESTGSTSVRIIGLGGIINGEARSDTLWLINSTGIQVYVK